MHRTEEQTRDLVAEKVVDYVAQHGIGVLPEFPMERILESSGVSRASAYRIWPGRAAFSAFAIEQCAAGNALATLTTKRALTLAEEALDTVVDRVSCAALFISSCADEELTLLLRSPRWRAFVCFQAVATGTSAAPLRTALEHADVEDSERLTRFYSTVADAWGLEAASGAGPTQIAHAAMLLVRSTAARIVFGFDEAQARDIYAASLTALVRGSFQTASDVNSGTERYRADVLAAVAAWSEPDARAAEPLPPVSSSATAESAHDAVRIFTFDR